MSAEPGSFLRGRKIVLYRPLFKNELKREGMEEDVVWPAFQLDDGTLVYPDPKPEEVPFFIGYVPTEPEGKRKLRFKFQTLRLN